MKTEKMIREILETLVKIDKLTRVQVGCIPVDNMPLDNNLIQEVNGND